MNWNASAARIGMVTAHRYRPGVWAGRCLALVALPILPAIALAFSASPAAAACVQSGNVVTCSGTTATGFGTGTENNLAITVQPGASITVGAAQPVIGVNNGNTVLNNGTITVGVNSTGMEGFANNSFTNAGTMTLGSGSTGMFAIGSGNTVTNTGIINSAASSVIGLSIGDNGNTAINSGTITLTGQGSTGIWAFGNSNGNTIQNSGVITVGGANGEGIVMESDNNTLTNTGTINAAGTGGEALSLFGNGNTVTNRGTIVGTGLNTAAFVIVGLNEQIVNYGTIKGGPNGYSMFTFGTTGTVVTNYGTIDGLLSVIGFGAGNAVTNAGLLTITDSLTPLSPGNFGISGTFTQTAQGTLALRVDNAGNRDGLFADNVNLGGTLRAVLQPGLYKTSTTYTDVVQSTSAISGQFSSVTSTSAFFNAVATYNSNSVDLTLTRYGFGAAPGETANQRAVGNSLEAGYSTGLSGAAATFYTTLLQSGSVRVLDQLSGEGTSGTQNTAFTAGAMFGQTMDGQMNAWRTGNRGDVAGGVALGYGEEHPNAVTSAFNAFKAPPMAQPEWHTWVAGFGAGQSLSGDAATGSAGFSDQVAGGAIGVDHIVNPNLLVGLAAGGSSASFTVDDRATSGHLDGGHVGAYAMQTFGASYLSAQVAYGHFNNTTTRTISGVGPTETATGAFGSDQFGGRLEIGHSFAFNPVTVTPFAAVQAARLWQAAYTETSTAGGLPGVLGLSYAAHGVSSLPVFLGTKFDGRFDAGNGMLWMPFVHVAWVHEFDPTRDVTATLTTMALPNFTVEGARAAADAGRVELGSRLVLNRWWEASARVTGEFSSAGQSYAGIGSLRASW